MSDDQKPQAALLLYSIEDVIARTSLGRSKLYELMASGELGSVKVGRRRLIPARALDEFIEGLTRTRCSRELSRRRPARREADR